MKRVLVFALLAVTVLGLSVSAGWHFAIEQNPLLPEAELTVGWGFGAERLGISNLFVSGDFFVVQDNLWNYPNPWICGFDIGLNHEGVLYFDLGMDLEFGPQLFPQQMQLDTWTTGLKITGKPSDVVTIWGEAEFEFAVVNPPGPPGWTGIWTFVPTLGIAIHLP